MLHSECKTRCEETAAPSGRAPRALGAVALTASAPACLTAPSGEKRVFLSDLAFNGLAQLGAETRVGAEAAAAERSRGAVSAASTLGAEIRAAAAALGAEHRAAARETALVVVCGLVVVAALLLKNMR